MFSTKNSLSLNCSITTELSLLMSKMAKHSWILICFVCFIMVSMVIADRNQVTSTSDSGMECNFI